MVAWTEPAKVDLRSIHDFIAHDSKYYAKKVIQDMREKSDILDKLPKREKTVAEIDDGNFRELSLYSYRIIYEIRREKIFIQAVVHKKRDFSADDIEK